VRRPGSATNLPTVPANHIAFPRNFFATLSTCGEHLEASQYDHDADVMEIPPGPAT